MRILISVITTVLQILLPALLKEARPRYREADRQLKLREKLRKVVRKTWPAIFLVVLISGCSHRFVYVPDGTPVRLRETINDAKVWVIDKDETIVAGKMDIPQGWYFLPVPDED